MSTENKDMSMEDRFKNLTANKSTVSNGSTEHVPEKLNTAAKNITKKWLYSDDDIKKEKPQETKTESTETENTETPTDDKKKYTDDDFESSGETMTGMIDMLLTNGLSLWERKKLKGAFTKDEWKRIKEIQRADIKKLVGDDLALREKVDRCLKKFSQRRKEIPFTEDEFSTNSRGFKRYYKASNKVISPEMMFWATIGNALLSRVGDTFFDDDYS